MIALLATLVLHQAPEDFSVDRVRMSRGSQAWDLQWSDAEDRMQGTLRPLDPIAERPLEVSAMIGTFQGADFDGPVTLTLRCGTWSDTKTVRRAKDERAWFASFTPQEDGECTLDFGFTSLRHKLLHAKVDVIPAPLSRLPWYIFLGLIISGLLGFGIRAALRKPE